MSTELTPRNDFINPLDSVEEFLDSNNWNGPTASATGSIAGNWSAMSCFYPCVYPHTYAWICP